MRTFTLFRRNCVASPQSIKKFLPLIFSIWAVWFLLKAGAAALEPSIFKINPNYDTVSKTIFRLAE